MSLLTKDQGHALVHLIEECSEVIKASTKILRYGPDSYHPDSPQRTNIDDLINEVSDLDAMLEICRDLKLTDKQTGEDVVQALKKKRKELKL